jgi:hypothetical protein
MERMGILIARFIKRHAQCMELKKKTRKETRVLEYRK